MINVMSCWLYMPKATKDALSQQIQKGQIKKGKCHYYNISLLLRIQKGNNFKLSSQNDKDN